jgi:hypothetical protein
MNVHSVHPFGNCFSGTSIASRSDRPHSLTTRKRKSGCSLAYFTIPDVDNTASASLATSGRHSGWTRIFRSGSGCLRRDLLMHVAESLPRDDVVLRHLLGDVVGQIPIGYEEDVLVGK